MAVNGLLPAYPRTGNPDHTPGINTRTYVATAIFSAMVAAEGASLLNSNQKPVIIAQAVTAAWALADALLLGG